MNHKNIISLYDAFIENKEFVMIMEYASGGELLKYVEDSGRLTEVEARRFFI